MNLQQTILNMIIVSVPEETFITYLLLILLGRYDFMDKNKLKINIIKIMSIAVIPNVILSNTLRFIFPHIINENIMPFICLTLEMLSICILCKIKNIKQIFKLLLSTTIGFVIFMLCELITMIIAIYFLKYSSNDFNQSAIQNFIILIPERLIEYGFLIYMYIKKNGAVQVDVIKQIISNKTLKYSVIVFSVINISVFMFISKYIIFNNLITPLAKSSQLIIVIVLLILVISNMWIVWILSISIYPKEKAEQKSCKGGDTYEDDII